MIRRAKPPIDSNSHDHKHKGTEQLKTLLLINFKFEILFTLIFFKAVILYPLVDLRFFSRRTLATSATANTAANNKKRKNYERCYNGKEPWILAYRYRLTRELRRPRVL